LLVVISIIALLIAILLPSMTRARKQAKLIVCMTNTKQLGQGCSTYAAEWNKLPGPLHPAVYRNQSVQQYLDAGYSLDSAKRQQSRQISWVLRTSLKDSSNQAGSITDKVSTCPEMSGANPDKNFEAFYNMTSPKKRVFPTHYSLNNWGGDEIEGNSAGSPTNSLRITSPKYYFGYSDYNGDSSKDLSPQAVEAIKRPSDEWMLADAWYRPRPNTQKTLFQQEGPYQSEWSGQAFPNFAPHMRKGSSAYSFSSANAWTAQCSTIRSTHSDSGMTATMFFDFHADRVRSKRAIVAGFELLYGFPGSVNLNFAAAPQGAAQKNAWNQIQWQ
jgi:type II secretory pathway pseudopilin PulG